MPEENKVKIKCPVEGCKEEWEIVEGDDYFELLYIQGQIKYHLANEHNPSELLEVAEDVFMELRCI